MINKYSDFILEKINLKKTTYYTTSGCDISINIYSDKIYIGKCDVEFLFKEDDFDDTIDDITYDKNIENEDYDNIKKSDFLKYKFITKIHGFEIESKHQNMGYGFESMKKIISYLTTNYSNSSNIYLYVFKNNYSAIKIYTRLGFNTIQTSGDVLTMKL